MDNNEYSVCERISLLNQTTANLLNKINSARYSIEQAQTTISQTEKELDDLNKYISLLSVSQKIVQEMIATFSIERIKTLEVIVTKCLRTIFFDKLLSFEVEIIDKRNTKNVYFYIVEETDENKYRFPLTTSSVAGGVLVITSFVMQVYFITYFNLPPIIFLDEAFSQVSDQYIGRLHQVLCGLKEAYGLIIVLITHDPRFTDLADRTYYVSNGVYSLAT